MFQLPQVFARIGKNQYIQGSRITTIQSLQSLQARAIYKAERHAKTLINGAAPHAAQSLVYLDNGQVISSSLTPRQIISSMTDATGKEFRRKQKRSTQKIEVVDVKLDPPDPETDYDAEDVRIATDPELEYEEYKVSDEELQGNQFNPNEEEEPDEEQITMEELLAEEDEEEEDVELDEEEDPE